MGELGSGNEEQGIETEITNGEPRSSRSPMTWRGSRRGRGIIALMRARNLWGWGWADRFPDDEARKSFAESAAAMLGFPALSLLPLPPLDRLNLPPPRLLPPPALAPIVSDDLLARASHSYGKGYRDLVRGFRGEYTHPPDLVATPRREEDVARVLEHCAKERIAVIPFGGGTSVVGGVEPEVPPRFRGTLSLDLRALDRVLEVDPVSRLARIQAGATGPALESALAAHGFTLRHYPQSFELSTLGGWIATRAGGHFATLYTHIDALVASLRMIAPTGEWKTRTLPASGAGPSPDRLAIGSEGTLGVITEATMRIHERPRFRAKAAVLFERFLDGVHAARAIAQSGLHPANCRLLDDREAALFGVTREKHSVLLLGFESSEHPLDAWIERAIAIAKECGGSCPEGARVSGPSDEANRSNGAAELWRSAFLEAPYLQTTMVSLGVIADTFETACTWSSFEALHAEVIERVRDAMKRAAGVGRLSCRLTHVYPDGPAPYYTFLAPAKIGGELEQWAEIKSAAAEALMSHGATITHHHAVGRVHRPWYEREAPPLFLRALKAVKRSLDPEGILNPGALIPPD
jgi:alkyldihydroxyacetonephosphate synthase